MNVNLPKRLKTYYQEDDSITRLMMLIPKEKFLIRSETGGDYGSDLILELISNNDQVTNFRTHIQIKSVKKCKKNRDGSISYPVPLATVNYLMNQPNSIFILYIVEDNVFLWQWITTIEKSFKEKNIDIKKTKQRTINYRFNLELSKTTFFKIHSKILNFGQAIRMMIESLENIHEKEKTISTFFSNFNDNYEYMLGSTYDRLNIPKKKLDLASSYIDQKKYKEALEIFVQLAKVFETEFLFWQCIILCIELKKYKKAEGYCNLILRKNCDNFDLYFLKGICLLKRKKYIQAINYLKKSLNISYNADVLYNIGYAYLMLDDKTKVINYCNKCLVLDRDFYAAHVIIAIAYFSWFDNQKAIYHLNQTLKIAPTCYQALSIKGEILRYEGKLNEAVECFDECLKYNKKDKIALYGAGVSLMQSQNIAEGSIYLNKWLKSNDIIFNNSKSLIIDIGEQKTSLLKFESDKLNSVKLSVNGSDKIKLNLNDKIFIGCLEVFHENGSSLIPAVGKYFKYTKDFNETLEQIKKRVYLMKFFDERKYVVFGDDVRVYIDEKIESIIVQLIFKDFAITGSIEQNLDGYYMFLDGYKEYDCFQINLCDGEKNDEIVICGVNNLEIKKLKIIK